MAKLRALETSSSRAINASTLYMEEEEESARGPEAAADAAPAAAAESGGDGALGLPAPAAAGGAVDAINTLPCKLLCLSYRACNLNPLIPAPNPIELTSHTMSYTMSYAMLYAMLY